MNINSFQLDFSPFIKAEDNILFNTLKLNDSIQQLDISVMNSENSVKIANKIIKINDK